MVRRRYQCISEQYNFLILFNAYLEAHAIVTYCATSVGISMLTMTNIYPSAILYRSLTLEEREMKWVIMFITFMLSTMAFAQDTVNSSTEKGMTLQQIYKARCIGVKSKKCEKVSRIKGRECDPAICQYSCLIMQCERGRCKEDLATKKFHCVCTNCKR